MIARRVQRALAYLLLLIVAIIGFAPFVLIVIYSTKSRIEILQVPPTLEFDWDQIVTNYEDVLIQRGFIEAIKNSIIVTASSVFISLVIAAPAAYAFSRLRFRGSGNWASWILSFRFMPPIAVAVPILLMMRSVDLVDTYPGLIIPYVAFSLPLTVWILIGFFDKIRASWTTPPWSTVPRASVCWSGSCCRSSGRG